MPVVSRPDGARIHYQVTGSGSQAVVMIQGLGVSSHFWFDMPERMAGESDADRTVVTVDNRGVGASEGSKRPWQTSDMAEDVVSAMDHAGVDQAVIVGNSLGGMVAQQMALRHPTRVQGLVLMASSPGLPLGRPPSPRAIMHMVKAQLGPKDEVIANLGPILLSRAHEPLAEQYLSAWPEALKGEQRVAAAGFLKQLAAAALHRPGDRLRDIHCPTVVLVGDGDRLMPVRNSYVLASKIPRATLEVLADVGHNILCVASDRLLDAVAQVERVVRYHAGQGQGRQSSGLLGGGGNVGGGRPAARFARPQQ